MIAALAAQDSIVTGTGELVLAAATLIGPALLALAAGGFGYLEGMAAFGLSAKLQHDALPFRAVGLGPWMEQVAEDVGDFVRHRLFHKVQWLLFCNIQVVADQRRLACMPTDLACCLTLEIALNPDPGRGPSQAEQPGLGLDQADLGGFDEVRFQAVAGLNNPLS